MAKIDETRDKILSYFEKNNWSIPDVAIALGITEQYLRKILNDPDKHMAQITHIIAYYKIR